ncbi:LolA family protein [Desulfogranum mediterraneum]|uniref:LolA family protein n=1 Tax=Desulfogranum mediterraneum TaxID=160661 RepID=UPI00042A6754|nr:outer membrane lipoprotein carrier protein LolA [Desulfogranum mediterraneum]
MSKLCSACLALLALALLCPGLLWSGQDQLSPGELQLRKIQERYQQLSSIGFDFSQQTTTSGRIRSGRGRAILYRQAPAEPGANPPTTIMRWDYLEPNQQSILNTGDQLSIYSRADNQLLITSTDRRNPDITLALFSGRTDLLESFAVASPEEHSPEAGATLTTLLLTPRKPHAQLQRLQIWFGADQLIQRLSMEDHFGAITTLDLSGITLDQVTPGDGKQLEALLDLELAPGTEIIRQ